MDNQQLFKQAHAMAKAIHVKGRDNYAVTFGACLKIVKAQAEAVEQKRCSKNSLLSVPFLVILVLCLAFVLAVPCKLFSDIQALAAVVSALAVYILDPFILFESVASVENKAVQRVERRIEPMLS